jgi:predicted transcriptional regulator
MSELELEIGRTLGASCFLIYQFIKHNPGSTSRDIQIETGLSENCVWMSLNKLKEANVIRHKLRTGTSRVNEYKENEEREKWMFH